jgi:hypothetical protein
MKPNTEENIMKTNMKTNTCHPCGSTMTTQEMLDNPDHGWTWSDKYGWGCPQHPAPSTHVYGTKGVQLITSWGDVFHYVGDVPDGQNRIDHLGRKCGLTPPAGPVSDCYVCELIDHPRHWPSVMCKSGARPHCTCDACF